MRSKRLQVIRENDPLDMPMGKYTKPIEIKHVQIMDRANGLTLIGIPVEREFGILVREKLFGNDPNVILYPANPPEKMNRNLKRVMGI
jgi:hypothetical protein